MSYLPVARDGHDAAEVYTRILHFGDNKIHGLQPHFNGRRDLALVGAFDRAIGGAIVGKFLVEINRGFVSYLAVLRNENSFETLSGKVKAQEKRRSLQ